MRFREKAVEILYKAATSRRKVRNLLTPVGASIFLALTALFVIVSLEVDRFLELPKLLAPSVSLIISAPILTAGLLLYLWSVVHFIKARGTPVPFNPPPKLVTSGPYAYLRNPILAGIFIFLFGLGILLRSISLIFIFTPLYVLLNVLVIKAIEEPELEKRLGKEYIEYKKKVPMFIPMWKGRIEK